MKLHPYPVIIGILILISLIFLPQHLAMTHGNVRKPQFSGIPDQFAHTSDSIGADTWSATDALNRKLLGYAEVGVPRSGKFVGIFYWTWHYAWANDYEAKNITTILQHYPAAIDDLYHPAWGPLYSPHFWNEPLFGYYRLDQDDWVLRKHAEMLADAGIDVVIFDATNGSFTWKNAYMNLCKVFSKARQDGVRTPKIAFMLAFAPTDGSLSAIKEIYQDLYQSKLYRELWFDWKGKPLIMAYPDNLVPVEGDEASTKLHQEIRDFFTFRPAEPRYNVEPARPDQWSWLQIYPQHGFYKLGPNKYEQIAVGVAQNWSKEQGLAAMNAPNTFGRSYTAVQGQSDSPEAVAMGLNVQEQWERALKIDPEFIFITGWNEWIAGRFDSWGGRSPNAFPDEFSNEKSRDIEPMKGGFGDNYYYQMVNNIRRFKGVAPEPTVSSAKSILIDGQKADWADVTPQFQAYPGNIQPRASAGWKGLYYYQDSGRNDIVLAQVARDADNIYFLVETAAPLSAPSGDNWMTLFIDIDRTHTSGWEGYDYVVNRSAPGEKARLEKQSGDGSWSWNEVGEISYAVDQNILELQIPRTMLDAVDKDIDLEFKWTDNLREPGNVMDFWISGDSAPAGRFNYHYQTHDFSPSEPVRCGQVIVPTKKRMVP
jgi:hypothetical protein